MRAKSAPESGPKMEAYSAPLLFLATVIKMAKAEGAEEGGYEKVDNGGRIYRTRTAVVGRRRRGEGKRRPEGHTLHTCALGQTETHPCTHASLHSVSRQA